MAEFIQQCKDLVALLEQEYPSEESETIIYQSPNAVLENTHMTLLAKVNTSAEQLTINMRLPGIKRALLLLTELGPGHDTVHVAILFKFVQCKYKDIPHLSLKNTNIYTST